MLFNNSNNVIFFSYIGLYKSLIVFYISILFFIIIARFFLGINGSYINV